MDGTQNFEDLRDVGERDKVIIITKKGIIKKLDVRKLRTLSRTARGLPAIKLDDGDEVVAMTTVMEEN